MPGKHHCRLHKQSLSRSWRQGFQGQPLLLRQPLFFFSLFSSLRHASTHANVRVNENQHSALLERQDLSCTYVAHHELENEYTLITMTFIIVIIPTRVTQAFW